jgi:hypothetical protein
MTYVSATDVAIRRAQQAGTLRIDERASRFGGTFIAISDDTGLIEVQLTQADADKRVQECAA